MIAERVPLEARSRHSRLAVSLGLPSGSEVENAIAARTLTELVGPEQLLEQHRLQSDVTGAAGAVTRPRESRALALSDHLVTTVEVGLQIGRASCRERV